MRFSRTTLSCLLHVKGYAAYSAFAFTYIFRLRSCSSIGAFLISPLPPMLSKSLQTAGPLPSTGVTRLHRYYQPLRHPLACQPISRGCRLYGLPLLRRFLNGARRASPVAWRVLVTVPSLPPRRSAVAPQPVCATPCCFRPRLEDSASGPSIFRGHLCVHSRYGPATRRPPLTVVVSMGFRSSVSLLPAIQTTGLWLLPRRAYPPLNAPAFAGRTSP